MITFEVYHESIISEESLSSFLAPNIIYLNSLDFLKWFRFIENRFLDPRWSDWIFFFLIFLGQELMSKYMKEQFMG